MHVGLHSISLLRTHSPGWPGRRATLDTEASVAFLSGPRHLPRTTTFYDYRSLHGLSLHRLEFAVTTLVHTREKPVYTTFQIWRAESGLPLRKKEVYRKDIRPGGSGERVKTRAERMTCSRSTRSRTR